jgi:hypothetical protein
MNRYAYAAMVTSRYSSRVESQQILGFVNAPDEQSALQAAQAIANAQWPLYDGWASAQVIVALVS